MAREYGRLPKGCRAPARISYAGSANFASRTFLVIAASCLGFFGYRQAQQTFALTTNSIRHVGKTPEVGCVEPAEVNDRHRRLCGRHRLSARSRMVAATTWPPMAVASMPRAQQSKNGLAVWTCLTVRRTRGWLNDARRGWMCHLTRCYEVRCGWAWLGDSGGWQQVRLPVGLPRDPANPSECSRSTEAAARPQTMQAAEPRSR